MNKQSDQLDSKQYDNITILDIILCELDDKLTEWQKEIVKARFKKIIHCKNCEFWNRDHISCEGFARCNTGESGIRFRKEYDFCSKGKLYEK